MPLEPLFAELEQNIADDLNVERLAEAGRLSRTQLYREFYNTTGHSVKEYVRKRAPLDCIKRCPSIWCERRDLKA